MYVITHDGRGRMMRAYAVTSWTMGHKSTQTVLAGEAHEAVAAVRALSPAAVVVETRPVHFGLDVADAMAACGGCGHPAKLHSSASFTGDYCDHAGYGHDGGRRVSTHLCTCQGFFPATY